MPNYYSRSLSGLRLQRCYEIAPPRVRQYFEAEVEHVLGRLEGVASVLELGCGYGRVLRAIANRVDFCLGIDTAEESLLLARQLARAEAPYRLACMNAIGLGIADGVFDAVVCIQNGVSAFGVDQRRLIREALRVTRGGGRVLFSSYSPRFWGPRLEWFELQARHGLLGEIDRDATGDGVIVCRDGFRSGTVEREEFERLVRDLDVRCTLTEVDRSSLFCELAV